MIYTEQNETKLLGASRVLVFCALESRGAFVLSRLCSADPRWRATRLASTSFSFLLKSLYDATDLLYTTHNPIFSSHDITTNVTGTFSKKHDVGEERKH